MLVLFKYTALAHSSFLQPQICYILKYTLVAIASYSYRRNYTFFVQSCLQHLPYSSLRYCILYYLLCTIIHTVVLITSFSELLKKMKWNFITINHLLKLFHAIINIHTHERLNFSKFQIPLFLLFQNKCSLFHLLFCNTTEPFFQFCMYNPED